MNNVNILKSNFEAFSKNHFNMLDPYAKKLKTRFPILKVGAILTVASLGLAFLGPSINYLRVITGLGIKNIKNYQMVQLDSLEGITQANVEEIVKQCLIQPTTRGGEHLICKPEQYPDLIFKIGTRGNYNGEFEREMSKEVKQREIIEKINKLELTHIFVPRLRTFSYENYPYGNYPIIVEEYLESNGIINPISFNQEHLFQMEGEKLNLAIEHLTKFLILIKSYSDLNPKNVIVLKQKDNDGNSKLGLIDTDGYEVSYKASLIGDVISKRDPSETPSSLINFCTNEQIEIVDQTASKILGSFIWGNVKIFNDFTNVKSKRQQSNKVLKELVRFHESKGIQGFEPINSQNLPPDEEYIINKFNEQLQKIAPTFAQLNYSIPRAREIRFLDDKINTKALNNLKSCGLIFDYTPIGYYIYIQG